MHHVYGSEKYMLRIKKTASILRRLWTLFKFLILIVR